MTNFLAQIQALEISALPTRRTRLKPRRERRLQARQEVKNSKNLTKEKAG